MSSIKAGLSAQMWLAFVEWYQITALALTRFYNVGDKFVHLVAGMLIWLAVAHVIRKPLDSRAPLVVLVVLALANEAMDFTYSTNWGLLEAGLDVVATVFFPFVVALSLRRLGPKALLEGETFELDR